MLSLRCRILELAFAALFFLCFAGTGHGSDFFTQVPTGKFPAVGRVVIYAQVEGKWAPVSAGTGTLIAKRIVLTAGHMLPGVSVPTQVRFELTKQDGKPYLIEDGAQPPRSPRAIAFRTHPRFIDRGQLNSLEAQVIANEDVMATNCNDMALLLLEREIPTEVVESYPALTSLPEKAGAEALAVGFGWIESRTNALSVKRMGKLEFMEKTARGAIFRTPSGQLQRPNHGDSGGPFFIEKDGKHQIVAITQGGSTFEKYKGLDTSFFAYCASIEQNRKWLDSAISQLNNMKFDQPRYFYLPRIANANTSQLPLSAQQILGLLSIDVPKERVVNQIFARGVNEPIPASVVQTWLKTYKGLTPQHFVEAPVNSLTSDSPSQSAK